MLIECQNCHTKFTLDEALIPPEGAWVRCSRCEEVFLADKFAAAEPAAFPPAMDTPRPDDPGFAFSKDDAMVDFGLDDDDELPTKKRGGFFRFLLWLIITVIILAVLAIGALVALDRLGLKPEWVDPVRNLQLPLLEKILQPPVQQSGSLSLNNVRAYYRDNQNAGRLFIIQGEVVNLSAVTQTSILVQGRLNDINNNPARQAVIYAGPVFSPEDLRELTLAQIQAALSQPQDAHGQPYLLAPQGSLPFMIVLGNLPDNISDYTVDVVGWEAVEN